MLYRSRISRSRLTASNCLGPSIRFLTSGRPTRSMRTLNVPRVSVSATTPTSAAPPSRPQSPSPPAPRAAGGLDYGPEYVLAVGEGGAVIAECELSGRDRLQRGGSIEDERVPP